jgi:hypothetical protein
MFLLKNEFDLSVLFFDKLQEKENISIIPNFWRSLFVIQNHIKFFDI